MKRIELIVSGDDFGASPQVNEAIIQAHQKGILTSCTLMVTGDAFEQAVRLAKQNAELAVGIHLVTIKGRPLLPPSKIPALVKTDGRFSDDPAIAGIRYFFSDRARRQLKEELKAQFHKFIETGLAISHIDSHLHMHIHPVLFQAALELGIEYGVRRMRVPRDDFGFICRIDPQLALKSAIPAAIFKVLCKRMKKMLEKSDFIFPRRVYGHFHTGVITEHVVLSMLEEMQGPANELYLHPAVYRKGRAMDRKQLHCKREFDILTSPKVRAKMVELGIQLTTYPKMQNSDRV